MALVLKKGFVHTETQCQLCHLTTEGVGNLRHMPQVAWASSVWHMGDWGSGGDQSGTRAGCKACLPKRLAPTELPEWSEISFFISG